MSAFSLSLVAPTTLRLPLLFGLVCSEAGLVGTPGDLKAHRDHKL